MRKDYVDPDDPSMRPTPTMKCGKRAKQAGIPGGEAVMVETPK